MRPFLVGVLCAALTYPAVWMYSSERGEGPGPRLAGSEETPAEHLARDDPDSSQHTARVETETQQVPSRPESVRGLQRSRSPSNASRQVAGRKERTGFPDKAHRTLRGDDAVAPGQLPPAVREALREMGGLEQATTQPQQLADRLQRLEADDANLEQLRDFAEGFVDIPTERIGPDRFQRDLQRATR